ncbi:MAG: PAS domain S-box protein [Sphingobacteriales bacterium]
MDKRLTFLLKNSNDILCVANTKGNIISVNSSWVHFTGYTEQESRNKTLLDLVHPADAHKINELLISIISLENIEGISARIETNTGSHLTISWSASFDVGNQLTYLVGIYSNERLNFRNPYNISDKVQYVLANLTEGFFMLDKNWRVNAFNPAFQKLLGTTENELYGADFRQIDELAVTDEVIPEFENIYKENRAGQLQYYDAYCKCWLQLNIYPYKEELLIFIKDISDIKIEQLVLNLEKRVLELNLIPDHSLAKIADELLNGIEQIFPEMYCSILEVDKAQEKVYHLSAPRLPQEYCNAINGSMIGPYAGSCGTAVYHREQVIVKDIANSPLWDNYKQYILPYGFKACWSTPVMSSKSTDALATFAIYYDTVREPGKDELRMVERTVNILRELVESKRNEEDLAEHTKRLQDIASISSHNIRRPVATILGLTSLFDKKNMDNPLNKEIMEHLETTALELDEVIHIIVEKTAAI